jgi:hypothetical protein
LRTIAIFLQGSTRFSERVRRLDALERSVATAHAERALACDFSE